MASPTGADARAARAWPLLPTLLFVAGLCFAGSGLLRADPRARLADFQGFYCAARAVAEGADPYRTEPLRTCEHTLRAGAFWRNLTMPAPLPGIAFVALAPLARLPWPLAALLWTLVLCAAWAIVCACTCSLARLPPLPVAAAFAFAGAYVSLELGQVFPPALAALCVAALCLERGRPRTAAVVASASLIEPHLALPALASLVLWVPKARTPLVACTALAALASFAALGPAANAEYLFQTLPAHALAEAGAFNQYSTTFLAVHAGLDDTNAVRVGELWYAAALVAGLVLGRRAARETACDALVVLVPAALAVFGGPYVHLVQVAAALPAALVLATRAPRARAAATAAVLLLAVPWLNAANSASVAALLVGGSTALLWWTFVRADVRASLIAAAATTAAVVLLAVAMPAWSPAPGVAARLTTFAAPGGSPEDAWSVFMHSAPAAAAFAYIKLPTWLGLALVVAAATQTGRRRVTAP